MAGTLKDRRRPRHKRGLASVRETWNPAPKASDVCIVFHKRVKISDLSPGADPKKRARCPAVQRLYMRDFSLL